MTAANDKLDPIVFAVIKARVDGIIAQMAEVVLRTSRNPILNLAKDFTCSIL
ncbi:MAG: hydantoinase B/oxoprolinase family protein, partial [Thermodesulfobacteriota bacterium]